MSDELVAERGINMMMMMTVVMMKSLTLNALERQDPPGRLQIGDVDEPDRVGDYSSIDDVYQTCAHATQHTT